MWTLDHELFRANFTQGEDLTGPLDGNQFVLSGTGFSNSANANSCIDCHSQLGRSTPPGAGTSETQGFSGSGRNLRTAPILIGLGLLEAIDQRTLEQFSLDNVSTSIIEAGRRVFMDRCARCHIPEVQTGNSHPIAQYRNLTIRPYTDLLLHDMGPELSSDDGGPLAQYWLTPTLWGLRLAAQTL